MSRGVCFCSSEAEEDIDRTEARLIVDRAVAQLDESERRLIWLRYFEQRSQSDIAHELISQMQVPGCCRGCCSSCAASSAHKVSSQLLPHERRERVFGRQPAAGYQPLGYVADFALGVAGGPAEPVEGGHRIQPVASHQIADTTLDDHPIVQGVLQLGSQLAGISAAGGGQRGFNDIAIASQRLALVVLPDVRPVIKDVKGADGNRTEAH